MSEELPPSLGPLKAGEQLGNKSKLETRALCSRAVVSQDVTQRWLLHRDSQTCPASLVLYDLFQKVLPATVDLVLAVISLTSVPRGS